MSTISSINLDSQREFHNRRFQDGDRRQAQQKYYWAIERGAVKYWESVTRHSKDAAVLDGRGLGEGLSALVPVARSLDGIDISEVAVASHRVGQ